MGPSVCTVGAAYPTMGIIDDPLARVRWLFGFQVTTLVYSVTRNLGGRDAESICARLDFTDDEVVRDSRYPDPVRQGTLPG